MAYDSARSKAVLFNGEAVWGSYESDVWEWDGAADRNGAALFEAKFANAQAEINASISLVSVTVYAGGSAYTEAGEDGAVLYVWDSHPGRWRELAVNGSSIDAPGLLTYQSGESGELRHLFFGDDRSLNFAITPAYPNGTAVNLSEIALDYVEATVKYRLPGAAE